MGGCDRVSQGPRSFQSEDRGHVGMIVEVSGNDDVDDNGKW